ncbi:hypothetical protein [Phenylobacterium sp.]|uniref:hypothetical protein n=1 Tax=Phenylobacterium sp. TaxID=1871053 RepID=UPI002F40960D
MDLHAIRIVEVELVSEFHDGLGLRDRPLEVREERLRIIAINPQADVIEPVLVCGFDLLRVEAKETVLQAELA